MKCTFVLATYQIATVANCVQLPLPLQQGPARKLQLSAVVNDLYPPFNARIECWELQSEFMRYPTIGSSLQLANVSNVTYVELPADTEGLHNAPYPMLFVLLSGMAMVTLPNNEDTILRITARENPVIVATDTVGKGHYTRYAGNKIAALQVPFRDGIPPDHVVLHDGQCSSAN